MSSEQRLLNELEDLADKWKWEYETYIESDVESERTMSVQQYSDWHDLRRLIEEYKDGPE